MPEYITSLYQIALRALLSVAVLFVISRIEGSRQISQLTFYDYIVGISIGSIAAMALDSSLPMLHIVVGMLVFGAFSYIVAVLTRKNMALRRLFSGRPIVMIYNGKIIKESLKQINFDINDLLLNCRLSGYFTLEDIAFAVLETNGELSIMPRSEKQPLTPYDMNLNPSPAGLEYNLIIDGKVLAQNLKHYGKDEIWLNRQLGEQKVNNVGDVLLAIGTSDDSLKVFLRDETLPHNDFFM